MQARVFGRCRVTEEESNKKSQNTPYSQTVNTQNLYTCTTCFCYPNCISKLWDTWTHTFNKYTSTCTLRIVFPSFPVSWHAVDGGVTWTKKEMTNSTRGIENEVVIIFLDWMWIYFQNSNLNSSKGHAYLRPVSF